MIFMYSSIPIQNIMQDVVDIICIVCKHMHTWCTYYMSPFACSSSISSNVNLYSRSQHFSNRPSRTMEELREAASSWWTSVHLRPPKCPGLRSKTASRSFLSHSARARESSVCNTRASQPASQGPGVSGREMTRWLRRGRPRFNAHHREPDRHHVVQWPGIRANNT